MIQTRTIANFTEIYSDQNGGGKSEIYITEAAPTMFPTFTMRRFLAEGQTPADFREVTAAERAKLEAAAEAWRRPPQLFIDQWNAACGIWGRYNEATGYFELNGLTDITYAEAVRILAYGPLLGDSPFVFGFTDNKIRTNIPAKRASGLGYISRFRAFMTRFSSSITEVVNLSDTLGNVTYVRSYREILNNSLRTDDSWSHYTFGAKKYIGILDMSQSRTYPSFGVGSKNVTELYLKGIHTNLEGDSLLSLKAGCWRYWVENSTATAPVTWTVPSTVYAKLTGDTTNAAAAALTEEELAEWMQLIPLAAEKNITFVAA